MRAMSRFFWFTVEFGLMRGPKGTCAYGSGLLSSSAELEHAIATAGATPTEALTAVEQACGTWRTIAEAQHAHNTVASHDAEAGEGQ